MKYKKKIIIGIIGLAVAACGTTARIFPDEKNLMEYQKKVPGITYDGVKQGAALYTKTCAGCHKLHHPSEYTADGWSKNLEEMFPKAHLDDKEKQTLIKNYLFALSK
jgi:cytochrome c5